VAAPYHALVALAAHDRVVHVLLVVHNRRQDAHEGEQGDEHECL
jgi:hypothetical protein